jgi:hypothetical protein
MEEKMKLRILVVAAGCLMLPAMASAQGDTTTKKDTSTKTTAVPVTDTTGQPTKIDTSGPQTAGCPKGCPTSRGAAGLTGVQFLALQQELRDRGCGNAHVTGHLDAPTRRAISVCAKQLNVANSAEAVLGALNIGFGPGDNAPTGGATSGAAMSGAAGNAMNTTTTGTRRRARAREGTKAEEAAEAPSTERAERSGARRGTRATRGRNTRMKGDSTMKHDSTMMMHDSTMNMKKDSTTPKKDSTSKL